MAAPSRLDISKKDIRAFFAARGRRIYTKQELAAVLVEQREFWRLAKRTTTDLFVEFLSKKLALKALTLRAPNYDKEIIRYSWEEPSPFALALSLKGKSYLSHASAIFLHGLTNLIPRTLYLNREQSTKPAPTQRLTQESMNRAFKNRARTSQLIYELEGGPSIVMLNGKQTGNLGVQDIDDPSGGSVKTTDLERTLIDCVVRPNYAGGVENILAAFRAARDRVSANAMRSTLKKLEYSYPYHQAIGFVMERSGYKSSQFELFRTLGLEFDFYLSHGLAQPDYDPKWRLYFPRDL